MYDATLNVNSDLILAVYGVEMGWWMLPCEHADHNAKKSRRRQEWVVQALASQPLRTPNLLLSRLQPRVIHYTPPTNMVNPVHAACICGDPIRRGEVMALAHLLHLYC